MGSSPGFGSTPCDFDATSVAPSPSSDSLSLRLRVYAPLTSPQRVTRWLILQKARGQIARATLPLLVSIRFQVLFHSGHPGSFHLSLTVLVHYRSSKVFSLGEWTPLLPTGLACPVVLKLPTGAPPLSDTGLSPPLVGLSSAFLLAVWFLTPRGWCSSPRRRLQPRPRNAYTLARGRFGLFPFRSPLLGICSLFLGVLRCFSSPRALLYAYAFSVGCPGIPPGGFPHSDISGSTLIGSSPKLFAACHVLLRPLTPRHPPYALSSLICLLATCTCFRICRTLFSF
jgi:hypothetical protein